VDSSSPVRELAERVVANVERVIVGKRSEVELAFIALLSQGHLLIEDVPGVGKTMLAKSLARSTGCAFKRIQFTPDLLPSDVTGLSVYNQKTAEFRFRPGPVFGQVVLADEINRATPKTQSALLETMEERQVTVEGESHPLPRPFMVMATQNPIEFAGTYPLPEAQLDRFLLQLRLGYPDRTQEAAIMVRQHQGNPFDELRPVAAPEEVVGAQQAVARVFVEESVTAYVADLVQRTRSHPDVALGASPRGSLGLYRTGQARAAVQGRDFVSPDDVKALAGPVLLHRLILKPAADLRGLSREHLLAELLGVQPVPAGRR
jgi:MoxR-like ATPase